MKINISIIIQLLMACLLAFLLLLPEKNSSHIPNQSTKKIYKSTETLHGYGREIKGGELDWKLYNFNGEVDVTGEGYKGIAKDAKIPASFPAQAAKLVVEYFDNVKLGCYALFDLDGNGIDEIFVQSDFGSGGLEYAILESQKGKWKIIFGFTGGFILHSFGLGVKDAEKYSSNYWYITNWDRSGIDLWQILSAYKDNGYVVVGGQATPLALQQLIYKQLDNIDASCDR